MSIRNYHVPDFKVQLDIISKYGFKDLESYRKAEVLIGESKTIELIHLYFSENGNQMIREIEELGEVPKLIEKFKVNSAVFPKATVAEVIGFSCSEIKISHAYGDGK